MMAAVTESMVQDVLKQVKDPGRNADIVSLGMVSGLVIKDDHILLTLEIDPARAKDMEPVRMDADRRLRALPGVVGVSVVLTAERQASAGGGHGAKPAEQRPMLPHVTSIIAVASGKGGVGKSTTAANLALAFAGMGLKVGLFDADIYGPSQPRMLGIEGEPHSPDGKILLPMENYGVKCMSIGFLVPEDSPVIWRGPMVIGALQQLLRDVEWGHLDVMVIDMPPGTGDTQLTMSQNVPLTGAVIVSTPQDIALLDARKGLNMFRKVDVPVLGVIENMSYYVCPNCGDEAHIFGHGGAREEAARLSCEFLGEVPLDIQIRECGDAGRPIVIADPAGPHAQAYRTIAQTVWNKVQLLLNRRKGPKISFE